MPKAGLFAVAAASALLGACSSDITVPNYNNPTTGGVAADPNSLQLLANGIAFRLGTSATGYISQLGELGRESYQYTPTEGRNFTAYVQSNPLDRAGFAGTSASLWADRYSNLRNVFNFQAAVAAANIPTASKTAASGFAKTMEALELAYILSTRDTIGIPIEVSNDLSFIAPFVSRDSAYRYISAQLDAGAADLAAATASSTPFPFTVSLQFTGVGAATPATFRQFNRAIAARMFAYRGSMGLNCGATSCYQQALTAVANSFPLVTGAQSRTTLDAGVYNSFSTSTGSTQNTLSPLTSGGAVQYAHPSILRDTLAAGRDANGRSVYATTENASRAADQRIRAKIRLLSSPGAGAAAIQPSSLTTPYGFSIYATASSPIPVIRVEELILLRAEANIQTGNLAAALADINTIRTASGGVTALASLGTTAQAIDALLYERRLSLLWEGHRIIDVRRLNRLNTLPVDKIATPVNSVQHYIQSVVPVPQAECLSRATVPELQPAICRT